jgi:hypothetical protein
MARRDAQLAQFGVLCHKEEAEIVDKQLTQSLRLRNKYMYKHTPFLLLNLNKYLSCHAHSSPS